MADINSLIFETERRSILFHRGTSMPDGSVLGYDGDPNLAVFDNTDGEFLLHNSPSGTNYMQKNVVPFVPWKKVSDDAGGLWLNTVVTAPPTTPSVHTVKSVLFNISNGSNYIGMRRVAFYLGSIKINQTHQVTETSSFYDSTNLFNPDLPLIGNLHEYGWLSSGNSQKILIVFDIPIEIDKIGINNFHSSGDNVEWGVRDIQISVSDGVLALTSLIEPIYTGQLRPHIEENKADEQIIQF